jgi:hypothetical protein
VGGGDGVLDVGAVGHRDLGDDVAGDRRADCYPALAGQ